MSETKERQWLVSREGAKGWKPFVWFDARKAARAYVAAKVAKGSRYKWRIDPIKRGPGA